MSAPSSYQSRLAASLIIVCLTGLLIYVGKSILIPLGFAVMLAMLLLPVVNWLVRKGLPDTLASILSIFVALLFVAGILYFLSAQVAVFMEDLPAIKQKLQQHWSDIQAWLNQSLGITPQKQDEAIAKAKENMQSSGSANMGTVVTGIASGLMMMILLPIYTFLILFYRKLLRRFIIDVFAPAPAKQTEEVLQESTGIVRSYMIGLLIEMAIVTVLNAAGFFIIGVQYAIFLAVLAAILNLIPYIGMLVASVLCMAITLTTSDNFSDVIWTGVILIVVQFIDNNFIMPYIVGSKVKINALMSIVGVLIGGLLAGISGMFLSIPIMAIAKTVFDRVDSLKPWGLLLGGEKEDTSTKSGRRKK